jgi:Xaa-Pro aminopeptidase
MTDAMLLVGDSERDQNLYYKTHFLAGDPFVYMESNGRKVLLTNSMELGRAEKESVVSEVKTLDDFGFKESFEATGDVYGALAQTVAHLSHDLGASGITIGPLFPVLIADHLRADGFELDIDPELLHMERRIKSRHELDAISEVQQATERAVQRGVGMIARSEERDGVLYVEGRPLTSERVRAEIEGSLLAEGMDTGLTPIIAGGPGAADPHWTGTGPLRAGEAIVMDVFPRSKRSRYFSDMTRTVVKGAPSPELAAMYDSVLQAQEAALREIRAGADGKKVNDAVLEVFRERGYAGDELGPKYIHGTGHGVGLDIHELPNLGTTSVELLEGDVVSVEPGLYDPTIGAIRIEDLVAVTRDGYLNFTKFPKQFEI